MPNELLLYSLLPVGTAYPNSPLTQTASHTTRREDEYKNTRREPEPKDGLGEHIEDGIVRDLGHDGDGA
ncbi:LOW QUALITY PROTEIN: hypothetical protein BC937DRAFT_93131 [Endogone sp. FLAS-F59071]|nr:LOW QUALITY PROTEIN: hypothetical protein BC937DRAFT_93131 [Endogone sp. FLAS-F59071]|eukprot:RUS21273.1 LOW QUALITY PROTEIN: hypothetical protein BC937DRAFT_93131 [Endogone sp. FLAS-F59071]